jgi:hypothetical protein
MEQVMEAPVAPARPGRMRRVLRMLMWAAIGVLVLILALAAGVLLVNRNDQAPSVEAQALEAMVASARRPRSDDDAIAGLAALSTRPAPLPVMATPETPATLDAAAERERADRRTSRGERLDDAFAACAARPIASDCARRLAEAEPDMPAWIARESALLESYRRLLPRRGWYEPPPPADPAAWRPPPVQGAFDGQYVLLAQAFVDARAGHGAAVRDALEADAAFWRAGLAAAPTLITKMVATAALRRNFDLGALALQRLPRDVVAAAIPPAWTRELTPDERSLLPALAWEWKQSREFMRAMHEGGSEDMRRKYGAGDASANVLFKPQATSNAKARLMHRIAHANAAPYPELQRAQRALYAQVERESRPYASIYNPIGRILSAIAVPGYVDYGSRIADLEARRRAALAVVALHRSQVPAADVPTALATAAQRNPYTGGPFAWNAPASCVRIGGIGRMDGDGCIPYAPAP